MKRGIEIYYNVLKNILDVNSEEMIQLDVSQVV